MLATKAALASGGITHCCLRCGLRMFFLTSARSCCRWRARQCAVRRPSPRAGAGSNGRNPPGPETGSARSILLLLRRRKSAAGRNWDCICASTPPRNPPRPAGAWSARSWQCWCPAPRQSGCRSSLRRAPIRPPSAGRAPSSAVVAVDGSSTGATSAIDVGAVRAPMIRRSQVMQTITTVGLDIAKSVFQVHCVDANGDVVVRRQLKRRYVLGFFQKLPPCLVGIEACASSHHWSRELKALGHTVRLIPPAYVRSYVKRQKNDAADAEAICEAVTKCDGVERPFEPAPKMPNV